MKFSGFVITGLISSLLVGCGNLTPSILGLAPDAKMIFSTRPQVGSHVLALIKLKEKPLLAALKNVGGKKQVDPEIKKILDDEQSRLVQELNAISPDIKIVYRYRLVLNGVAIVAPVTAVEKIRHLTNVVSVESAASFSRPAPLSDVAPLTQPISDFAARNSVKFIGSLDAHQRGFRGQGIRVGIIDTGIDFTHAMFGGVGTKEAYQSIDPNAAAPGYPSAKVVGGVDLAGTRYDAGSANFMNRLPIPDENPIDEGGHGTHVAGTVAGRGDGVNTYDGVAPDASLFAIKVFGADGSTSDAVVIAALEFAADPNRDADVSDQLDVVNLSLGGGYGDAHVLYTEAISNLSKAGTSVVCSAGNSGDTSYIVGSPSIADDAISVAASVDDMDSNWKFRAVRFSALSEPDVVVEAIEASISKPIADAGLVTGPLVHIGLADTDLTDELKAAVSGKVALIDRGVVAFSEKIRRAFDAGAIGVVVANNQPGAPLSMGGGEKKYDLPAIMITQELGQKLKSVMTRTEVQIEFNTPTRIEKPELIDTITGFSSKGPRSLDALVKPEISSPGSRTVSAKMGGGTEGVALSGTSMAAPHLAGVAALLRQARPELSSEERKSAIMSTATLISAADKKQYPVSRQGAGRVQVIPAIDAKIASFPQAISLGEVTLELTKTMARSLRLKNLSHQAVSGVLSFSNTDSLRMLPTAAIDLQPGESKSVELRFVVDANRLTQSSAELDGFVSFNGNGVTLARVPVLAVVNKLSQLQATSLVVRSTSEADSQGALAELSIKNMGVHGGEAYIFNLIDSDSRKLDPSQDRFRSRACDLQSSGYRVIERDGVQILQFAAKLYEPMTTWDQCEVSVLIDSNDDGIADQELVGTKQDRLKGLSANKFASLLLDAPLARQLRTQFEADTIAGKKDPKEDYASAVQELSTMFAPEHSTIAIVEAPLASFKLARSGALRVRIATSYQETSAIEADDFLVEDPNEWLSLNVGVEGTGFFGMLEKTPLLAGESQTISLTKGASENELLVLYPSNRPVIGGLQLDRQSEILRPSYNP